MSAVGTLCAQSKVSVDGQVYLEELRQMRAELLRTNSTAAVENPTVSAIVMLADGHDASELAAAGYNVVNDMNISAIVEVNVSQIEELAALDAVQSMSFGGKKSIRMDLARKSAGVDAAHQGIDIDGTTRSFKGKGVLLGMYDSGLEGNHLNFFKYDESGAKTGSRIQRLWHYTGYLASQKNTYTANTVSRFDWDTQYETHATHVAGIMTGSYTGKGDYAYTTGPTNAGGLVQRKGMPMVYQGVAPEADLAFSVGGLYDATILDGVEQIVKYSKSMGKPAVINLSLGSNSGPHDGTDEYTATLNELGKDAIICMSSGNEAEHDMSLRKTFTEGDTQLHTFLVPDAKAYSMLNATPCVDGTIDIWSSDAEPITVALQTYRILNGSITNITSTNSATTSFSASANTPGLSSGRGTMIRGVDKNSGRYFVRITPNSNYPLMLNSAYRLAIAVSGKAGKRIDIYYAGGYGDLTAANVDGYTNGSAGQSINSSAVAENIIAVGSYNTRQYFGLLSSNKAFTNGAGSPDDISTFSSYGTDTNDQPLPLILAPGSTIISSYNRGFVSAANMAQYTTGRATNGTNTDYWAASDGTSMASPFAAGVIALWLEADPTLDAAAVKDVLAHSCTTDSYTQANPDKVRYGKINAEAGLRYILTGASAIGSIKEDDNQRLLITPTADGYDVVLAGEAAFDVQLFDMQGRMVASTEGRDAQARISTAGLGSGVYVIAVRGASTSLSRKVTVR